MKNRYLLPSLFLLLAGGPAWAQRTPAAPPADAPAQPVRVELLAPENRTEVHVQPLATDSSVVVLLGRDAPLSGKTSFVFQQYDSELLLQREVPLDVPDEFHFVRMCAENTAVFTVFSSRLMPGRLWVAAYDGEQGRTRTQQFETRLSREIVELKALHNRLFATVMLSDNQHVTALLLDVATGQFQYLPAVYEQAPMNISFMADPAGRRAEYVLSQTNGHKSRLLLKQLTERGQLISSEFVQAESERSLITAQLSPPQDSSTRLLMGTYSLRNPTYAQGLFATDLSADYGLRPPLRFYDFLHLKHFFDYLKPARQERLRRRIARRTARALPPLRWHYRLLLHELRPQSDGGYVLLAEVYYPHYRYNNYGANVAAPGPFGMGSTRVFDGFQTTHVLVCGFDRHGTLLWDNTFVTENLRRYDLQETTRGQVLPDGRLALMYLEENNLRYKILQGSEPSPNDHFIPLRTNSPEVKEKTLETTQADVQPWFGTRFIAHGFQRVRNEAGREREVFFLNAVRF